MQCVCLLLGKRIHCVCFQYIYIKNILYGQEAASVRPSVPGGAHFTSCCLHHFLQIVREQIDTFAAHLCALKFRSFILCARRIRSGNAKF